MVWIPEDVIWAKAYQLCGPQGNATPFWTAAKQILESQAQVSLAEQAVLEMEAKAERAEQLLQEAETRSLTTAQALQEAHQKIQTLETTLATQRASSLPQTPPAPPAPAPAVPQRSHSLPLWIAFFAVLGLSIEIILPFVLPNSAGTRIESPSE